MTKPAFSKLNLAQAAVEARPLGDGALLLVPKARLGSFARSTGSVLRRWAEEAPDRVFLAERDTAGAWRKKSYRESLEAVESIAQALLDRGLSADRPVLLLSENGFEHALMQLAAMHVGIPAVPISPAYSLLSRDHARLRYIFDLVEPGLVFASDRERYAAALAVLPRARDAVVDAAAVKALAAARRGPEVESHFAAVGEDTVAKILFTSGSAGDPKGVLTTQRMLCSNQQAIAQLWPFLAERPPVLVDWLPWSHTFGGSHNFNLALFQGGALYIDGGKPAPGLIEKTVENLREVAPTVYFNVPRGFEMLVPYLEQDAAFRSHFFQRLDLIFYAGASLPQSLWDRLDAASVEARGEPVFLTSAWGLTETAPLTTSAHFPLERAGVIGVPAPGCEVKLVPCGDKLEIRVRGPNVTPGYFKRADLTREVFDEEGFLRTGDAVRLADPENPSRGLVFDGRVAEDFKLSSGTWVHVSEIRLRVIAACDPAVQDAVVTGQDRDQVGLLIFPSPSLPPGEARARIASGLEAYNRDHAASSRRVARALILEEPPSLDGGEVTDKGYINQRRVLERRAAMVERLYAGVGDEVLRPGG